MNGQEALPGRLILLAGAYAPVIAIVGLRLLPADCGWFVLAGGILVSGVWLWFLSWLEHRAQPREVMLESFEPIDAEVTGYIASLLLPVVAAGSPDTGDLIAYGVCAVLILAVALAADLGAANPIIYFRGLRVGRARIAGRTAIVLFRREPALDRPVTASAATGVVLLADDQRRRLDDG